MRTYTIQGWTQRDCKGRRKGKPSTALTFKDALAIAASRLRDCRSVRITPVDPDRRKGVAS